MAHNKRSYSEIDETQKFFDSISGNIKDFVKGSKECCIDGCHIIDLGYGIKGGEKTVCKKHAHMVPNAVRLERPCRFKQCMKSGSIVVGKYKFCSAHRKKLQDTGLPKEAPIKKQWTPTCKHEGCTKVPSFDNKTKCKEHATSNKSDDNRKCKVSGCTDSRRPRYGFEGGKPTHCQKHGMEPGMVDLSGVGCAFKGCTKRASFRKDKDSNLEYCGDHKPNGYVLKVRTCVHNGCELQPSFGPRDSLDYTYCSEHAPPGYIDVKNLRCRHTGCNLSVSFGVKGGERLWCFTHKTDDSINLVESICPMACCSSGDGLQAQYFHPDHLDKESEFYKKRICSFARRVLIEDAIMSNDPLRVGSLLGHFKLDKVLTLNAQSAFRFECESRYHRELVDCVSVQFDGQVHEGRKTIESKRPDIFYKWVIDGEGFGIHIEYDEDKRHEDNDERIEIIEKDSGCEGRMYVIRVYGGHDSKDPVCSRTKPSENYEYYRVTPSGKEICEEVSNMVKERIGWIRNGIYPTDKNRKIVI